MYINVNVNDVSIFYYDLDLYLFFHVSEDFIFEVKDNNKTMKLRLILKHKIIIIGFIYNNN